MLRPRAWIHLRIFVVAVRLPVIAFVTFWFLLQLASLASGGPGVAWHAHILGFLAGILAGTALELSRRGIPPGDHEWA